MRKKLNNNTSVEKLRFLLRLKLQGVKQLEKIIFAKHLAIAMKAGLDIVEALEALSQQTESSIFREIILEIKDRVEQGDSLSDSLQDYPDVFSQLFVDVIYTGERGGTLPDNLEYLGEQLERDYDLRRKVKGAMMHPMIVFIAALGVGMMLAIFILPRITELYSSFGPELPTISRLLLNVTDFMRNYWLIGIVGLFIVCIAYFLLKRITSVKYVLDMIKLKLPALGSLTKSLHQARMCRTLGTLLKSGVPIQSAIDATSGTVDNLVYSRLCKNVGEAVERGDTMYSVLKKHSKVIPPLVSRMISLGERTGSLEENLLYLGGFYEKELDERAKRLTTSLEPLLLIFVGLLVSIIAIAIIYPIYNLTGSLSRYA